MKVYFGASITLSRDLLPHYQTIVSEIKSQGNRVLSEHVVDPKLKTQEKLDAKKIFADEVTKIEAADLMVAEVTQPSWGTAFLMEQTLKKGKPVLALFYKDAKHKLPLMIEGHPDFYLDHYDEDNIGSVLRHFFKFVEETKRRRGKLIVIDGIDASGKATQTRLLKQALEKFGYRVKTVSFPRYYSSFHGRTIGRFLSGEFGSVGEVSPYLASLAYALDRITARKQIREWLEGGSMVIADRYTSSTMAHQAAKLPLRKRKGFVNWVDELEYRRHKIPREDLTLFLYVPFEVSRKLLRKKGWRKYARGKRTDIAEADREHQQKALKMYLRLARERRNWVKINCVDRKGKILPKEKIQQKILEVLRRRRVIKL